MIGGQTADILLTGKIPSPDEIDYIYQNKTGALLKASMGIGAILGGAGLEQEAGIEKIAACLGMAYQIRDDILDVESSPELLGKPVLSDDKNNKITYVSLYGMEEAKKEAERLGQEALELLVRISPEKGELYALMEGLLHRKK